MTTYVATAVRPSSAGWGGRPLPEGQQGLPPRLLHLGWFPPLFSLLGFPTGMRPAGHPGPGSHTFVFRLPPGRAGAHPSAPVGTRVAPGLRGPATTGAPTAAPDALGGLQLGARSPPSVLASPRLGLVLQTTSALCCFAFFLPRCPQPQRIFLCIDRTLLVRKQYHHFRSEEERDTSLVEGKFSFTVETRSCSSAPPWSALAAEGRCFLIFVF